MRILLLKARPDFFGGALLWLLRGKAKSLGANSAPGGRRVSEPVAVFLAGLHRRIPYSLAVWLAPTTDGNDRRNSYGGETKASVLAGQLKASCTKQRQRNCRNDDRPRRHAPISLGSRFLSQSKIPTVKIFCSSTCMALVTLLIYRKYVVNQPALLLCELWFWLRCISEVKGVASLCRLLVEGATTLVAVARTFGVWCSAIAAEHLVPLIRTMILPVA